MNERKKPIIVRNNYMMLVVVIFLCIYGAIMVFSATADQCSISEDYENDSFFLLKRQGMFMAAGFVVMLVVQQFHYKLLKGFLAIALYVSGIGSIFLLKTSLGVSVNGATRWVKLGPFGQFQVSEWVKVCVIVFVAYLIDRNKRHLGSKKLTFYLWAAGAAPALMLFKLSNDLSSSVVVMGICFAMTFISAKTENLHIFMLIAAFAFVALYVWNIWNNMPTPEDLKLMPFRDRRIAAWLDPERYAASQGYQTLQALYAIGRGGVFGKGLGASIQKLGPIPEAETDMIFSVICEELGMIGALVLIYLFAYLLYQISRVMMSAPDLFGGMLALGVFFHLAIQILFNLCVNLAILPNTGLPLPFISYGGTSVFFLLAGEMGMVFSVERRIGREAG